MTFAKQVQHFVRFDLKRTSLWWMLYLVLLAIAPFAMFGRPLYGKLPDVSRMALPILTWCTAMGIAVTVVQADLPLSNTAFWKGKPIDGRALGTAKLVVVGLVILAAAVVGVIAWRTVDMPGELIMPTLRQAVPAFLIPVLFTALFGAVTRSLTWALLLSIGFLFFIVVLLPVTFLFSVPTVSVGVNARMWSNIGGSVLVCTMGMLSMMYRWPRTTSVRPALLVAVAVVLGTAATVSQVFAVQRVRSAISIPYAERTLVRVTADAPGSMPETVHFDTLPRLSTIGRSVSFTVVGARSDRRYELHRVRLTPFDGRGIGGSMIALTTTMLAVPAEALQVDTARGWTYFAPKPTTQFADKGFVRGDFRVEEELDTVRTIALEGVVVRYRAERVREVPFAPGVIFADSTVTIQITNEANGLLELAWTSFYNEVDQSGVADGTFPHFRRFTFAVIDSTQRTVRPLGASSQLGITEWMVLPRAFRWVNRNPLDYQPALRALLGRKTASLVVYKWVEDGRRRVRQSIRVNDWPRREPRRQLPRALVTNAP